MNRYNLSPLGLLVLGLTVGCSNPHAESSSTFGSFDAVERAAASNQTGVSFFGSWATSPLLGGWEYKQALSDNRMELDSTTLTWHNLPSAKVIVEPGDDPLNPGSGTERAEVLNLVDSSGNVIDENIMSGTQYYAFSYLFPSSWDIVNTKGWEILLQLHGPDELNLAPAFAISASGQSLSFDITSGDQSTIHQTGNNLGKVVPGNWTDFVMKVTYSGTSSGHVTIYRRDQGQSGFTLILDLATPTLQYVSTQNSAIGGHYWKQGIYRRGAGGRTDTLWIGSFARGTSFSAVEQATFGTNTGQPGGAQPTPTPTPTPKATPLATAAPEMLFQKQLPALLNSSDGSGVNYELGMKFSAQVCGQISAIRFYKGSSESGTHIGRIFSSTGAELTQVTFRNETASGWQQQALATPLPISANTVYLVSVNTGNTYYDDTVNGFLSNIKNGDLVGTNGYYGPVGSMPMRNYKNSNYFRDIVFTASSAAPTPPPKPTPTATPSPTPTPKSPTAFPNATNTGYAPTGQVLGAPQGDMIITTPGVYTGLNATTIRIKVSNVTIQKSRIASSSDNLILIESGLSGVVIQDTELIGGGIAGNVVGQNGVDIYGGAGGDVQVLRCNIHEIGSGVYVGDGPTLIQDNYIHDLNGSSQTHYNGIQDNGSTNVVDIEHNSIVNQNGWTDAVMLDNQFSRLANITVNDNYLVGGAYTLYVDGSLTPSNSIAAISITNNQITPGQYGYFLTRDYTSIFVQGNIDYVTGQPISP